MAEATRTAYECALAELIGGWRRAFVAAGPSLLVVVVVLHSYHCKAPLGNAVVRGHQVLPPQPRAPCPPQSAPAPTVHSDSGASNGVCRPVVSPVEAGGRVASESYALPYPPPQTSLPPRPAKQSPPPSDVLERPYTAGGQNATAQGPQPSTTVGSAAVQRWGRDGVGVCCVKPRGCGGALSCEARAPGGEGAGRRWQGCIRRGRGGGVGWDTPPPRVPPWSLPKAGRKLLSFNPRGAEDAEAKFWLSASNIRTQEGGGGCPPRCSSPVAPLLILWPLPHQRNAPVRQPDPRTIAKWCAGLFSFHEQQKGRSLLRILGVLGRPPKVRCRAPAAPAPAAPAFARPSRRSQSAAVPDQARLGGGRVKTD